MAARFRAAAERICGSNPKEASTYLRKAAEIYDSIGRFEFAAECFYDLREYKRADEAVAKVSLDTIAAFGKYRGWADCATPTAPIQSTGESSSQRGKRHAGMSSFGGLDEMLLSEQEDYGEEYTEFQVYIISKPKKLTDFSSDQLLGFWKTQESQFPILTKMA